MTGLGYLFAAYTIAWLALAVYLILVSRSIGGLRRDVQALREILREHEQASSRAGAALGRADASPS